MRARKFGLSSDTNVINTLYHRFRPESVLAFFRFSVSEEAVSRDRRSAHADYKKQRQNGTDEDNPERLFPNDGVYDWVSEEDIAYYLKLPPRPNHYRARYTEGPKDKAWMEERDQNYLARRAREEAQQQQDAGPGAASSPSP